MQPMSRSDAEHLAAIGTACRGWDADSCLAYLADVRHRDVRDVMTAWAHFLADEGVNSPAAFPNPRGPHWNGTRATAPTPGIYRGTDWCPEHAGRHRDRCPFHKPDEKPRPAQHHHGVEMPDDIKHMRDRLRERAEAWADQKTRNAQATASPADSHPTPGQPDHHNHTEPAEGKNEGEAHE